MKRSLFVVLVVAIVFWSGAGRPVQGFGSATHLYIAEHALLSLSANALYGSMAPDIATVSPENHAYFNLVPHATTLPQRMFAVGWMTHNEVWGADSFAHVQAGGYAWTKGDAILAVVPPEYGLSSLPDARLLGHLAAEIAVDLLLETRDPLLGLKVYTAAQLRSEQVPAFLYQSGAISDATAAGQGEAVFREFTKQYGYALMLSSPSRLGAIAQFVSQAAQLQYGAPPEFTPAVAEQILALSVQLCRPDYLPVVNAAIRQVQFRVWRGQF